MLPQCCNDIHYPLSHEFILSNKSIESSKNLPLFNNICCFDYLINIEEYFNDNMNEIYFYKKFIKSIYELDKKNNLDFQSYNKDSLIKFIMILNKTSCYYYTQKKIKYSKYLCNLSVKIVQIIFQAENENIFQKNQYKNNGKFLNDINDKNFISNIYNNACCNYLKTFSYNKSMIFLDYSFKNIEEDDINNKMIYYNNLIIISIKNIANYNFINNSIKALYKLIQTRMEYFNKIYNHNSYVNNGENYEIIKNKLKANQEDYKSFKLLCFIMYNYLLFIDKILKNKEQTNNLCNVNYEYVKKFLGKSSFEAQKFLIRLKGGIKNRKREEENKSLVNKKIDNKINKNHRHSENDINLRLKNIYKKIEEFEEILQNKKILDIIKEKNSNNEDLSKPNNNEIIKNSNNLLEKENIKNKLERNDNDNNNNQNKNNINEKNPLNMNAQKRERITFDMMDNIIEEFKKESQEKLEADKKLKEEKEKKKLDNINKEDTNNEETPNIQNMRSDLSAKKAPRIKQLFQKVLGTTKKETKKTKLGELFQSLMGSRHEDKKSDENFGQIQEKREEIKVGKEKENNFINLDDDDDEDENKNIDEDKNKGEENKKENKTKDNLNNNQNCGFGFKININLDPSSYSYDATTLYQEAEN